LTLSVPGRKAEFRAMGNARRLTGIAGRWSAGHPWTAIAAWIEAEQMISRDFPRHAAEDVLFDSPGLRVAVTGETAGTADFNALMGQRAPWVYAFVLLLVSLGRSQGRP
jgi:hypothetical protein